MRNTLSKMCAKNGEQDNCGHRSTRLEKQLQNATVRCHNCCMRDSLVLGMRNAGFVKRNDPSTLKYGWEEGWFLGIFYCITAIMREATGV